MSVKARSVAVIGAGPAGAIATDALVKELAFDRIRVFDRRPVIGGTWVYTPHLPAGIPSIRDLVDENVDLPVAIPAELPAVVPFSEAVNSHQIRFSDTAQHENLHSNIDPSIMSYTEHPFPDYVSPRLKKRYGENAPFRDHETIREWVEDIFAGSGYDSRRLLSLNTTVERAEKQDGQWVLTLRRADPADQKNHWWQERFDALVVASGHYNVPWLPRIPGLAEFAEAYPGRIVHSKHFRRGDQFQGKKVVVVGASVSASEIVHELLPYAQHPVIGSLRGEPLPAFGYIPWTHPHVAIKKQITQFDAATGRVTFEDGSSADDIDHVIFGTGYTFSLPFLPAVQARVKAAYRRLPGVYQHTWNIDDPTLTFVGMLGGGFTFRVYEWQAVAVARFLAGRSQKPLPPAAEQWAWEKQRAATLGGGKAYYSIAPNYQEFFEFLRAVAGPAKEGTTGRELPPFDPAWLETWAGMIKPRLAAWERARKEAEAAIAGGSAKAKL